MSARLSILAVVVQLGTAAADPAPTSPTSPSSSLTDPASASLVLRPMKLTELPRPLSAPSVRIEAARVAAERFAENWRYPEPGPLFGNDGGWYYGQHYRPLSNRSSKLHAGSVVASLVGEILMASDSPLAGFGALLTGATLDAAAADADRDAEARRGR